MKSDWDFTFCNVKLLSDAVGMQLYEVAIHYDGNVNELCRFGRKCGLKKKK